MKYYPSQNDLLGDIHHSSGFVTLDPELQSPEQITPVLMGEPNHPELKDI